MLMVLLLTYGPTHTVWPVGLRPGGHTSKSSPRPIWPQAIRPYGAEQTKKKKSKRKRNTFLSSISSIMVVQ